MANIIGLTKAGAMRDSAVRRIAASRVRSLRCQLGMTREQCAAELGCSVRALASWELAESAAPVDALVALEALLAARAA